MTENATNHRIPAQATFRLCSQGGAHNNLQTKQRDRLQPCTIHTWLPVKVLGWKFGRDPLDRRTSALAALR
jgi:hypothetical protein